MIYKMQQVKCLTQVFHFVNSKMYCCFILFCGHCDAGRATVTNYVEVTLRTHLTRFLFFLNVIEQIQKMFLKSRNLNLTQKILFLQ